MRVWWAARATVSMRVCCVTTVLAALALRAAAEPARRYSAEWRDRELARPRPLQELFEADAPQPAGERAYAPAAERAYAPPAPLPPGALHKERRRSRNSKRAQHLPSEIASQMMLRASRSNRPYDVPQIGKSKILLRSSTPPEAEMYIVVYMSLCNIRTLSF